MKVTQLTHVEPDPEPEKQPDLQATLQVRREVKEELGERHRRLVQRAKNQKKELRALNKAIRLHSLVAKGYLQVALRLRNEADALRQELEATRKALPSARRWWHWLLFWK